MTTVCSLRETLRVAQAQPKMPTPKKTLNSKRISLRHMSNSYALKNRTLSAVSDSLTSATLAITVAKTLTAYSFNAHALTTSKRSWFLNHFDNLFSFRHIIHLSRDTTANSKCTLRFHTKSTDFLCPQKLNAKLAHANAVHGILLKTTMSASYNSFLQLDPSPSPPCISSDPLHNHIMSAVYFLLSLTTI